MIVGSVTRQEIEAAKSPAGGWTKKQLAAWGVPWPPPKGWRRVIEIKESAGERSRWHKQRFHHRPEDGVFGDCYRTALACVLGLEPDDLPHEHRRFADNEQRTFYDAALAPMGVRIAMFAWTCDLDTVFEVMKVSNPGIHYILSGWSRSDANHSVVALEDKIVWDPSLTDAGIVGPCDNGAYYIELLVKR